MEKLFREARENRKSYFIFGLLVAGSLALSTKFLYDSFYQTNRDLFRESYIEKKEGSLDSLDSLLLDQSFN